MSSLGKIRSVIMAKLSQLHVDRVRRADDLAAGTGNVIDLELDATISKVVRVAVSGSATSSRIARITQQLGGMAGRMADRLKPQMEKLLQWSSEKTAMIFTTELPRPWLAARVREEQAKAGKKATPVDDIAAMTKAEYQDMVKRYVLPPIKKADAEATMKRKVITVNSKAERVEMDWEERINSLSKLVQPDRVAAEIVASASNGETVQALSKRLVAETKGVGASARRIARTETMRQMGDESERRSSQLGDIYIGRQYIATLDEIVRPEHAMLHGRIWWNNGMQPPLSEMPRPPLMYNCRCDSVDVLAPPKAALNDPNWLADMQAAGKAAHPDVATMHEWWATADESRKRISVGSKRFDAMRDILAREPEWGDFVSPDGAILPINVLRAETTVDRMRRRSQIDATVGSQGDLVRQLAVQGFVLP